MQGLIRADLFEKSKGIEKEQVDRQLQKPGVVLLPCDVAEVWCPLPLTAVVPDATQTRETTAADAALRSRFMAALSCRNGVLPHDLIIAPFLPLTPPTSLLISYTSEVPRGTRDSTWDLENDNCDKKSMQAAQQTELEAMTDMFNKYAFSLLVLLD